MWALLSGGCLDSRVDARARAEAEKAKRTIEAELHPGSSESEIVDFFQRHGWRFSFDDFNECFSSDVYRAPEKTHAVMVRIYVNKKREFVRSDVRVDITYF